MNRMPGVKSGQQPYRSRSFRPGSSRYPGDGGGAACIWVTWLPTPIGPMAAGATDQGICFLSFVDGCLAEPQSPSLDQFLSSRQGVSLRDMLGLPLVPGVNQHLSRLEDELARYFAGSLRRFTVPCVFHGTAFQQEVWRQLCLIPYGETWSYQELAAAVHRPGAVRAVGQANARNPIAIVVPCHRVVRKNGDPGGYAAQPWRKNYLLELERRFVSV